VNEKDFQIFEKENKDQFDYFDENFRLNNEKLIANKDEDMNDNKMIVKEILNNRIFYSIDVSLNNVEELIIMNEFDHHDLLLLIVQDVLKIFH
jgi:hypothetical protein